MENTVQPDTGTLQARQVALDILTQVLTQKIPLDQVLDAHGGLAALSARDRGFTRMIVATVLRRRGQIDDLLIRASEKGALPHPPLLLHLVRMGVAQLVFMDVPDHAAVDTTVRLAESSGMGRQKGFVNAVLRRIIRDGREWFAVQDEARLNIPDWLMDIWVTDYGVEQAEQIALSSLEEAMLDITLKDPAQAAYWAEQLDAMILPTGSLRREAGGNVQNLSGFDTGEWWVQDAAAAIPVKLCSDFIRKKHDAMTIIDLCAAPGGKTAQLAAQGVGVGGLKITALDRSAKRLVRLEENLDRIGLGTARGEGPQIQIVTADATVWTPQEKADLVLLDAPCSATGTIRRHPDILSLKNRQDQDNLASLQQRILDNAVNIVASGGMLVYCTCSLQKDEGERQIDSFLQRHEGVFSRLPVTAAELGGWDEAITPEGDVRVLPHHLGGIDGFFVSRLIRHE